jgi:DNA replication and repair protein RecF
LLDDVSSELDPDRSQALLDYLATVRCQIFVTTTRRDLVVAPSLSGRDRLDLQVEAGRVAPVG